MRQVIPLKFISRLILVIMLTVAINGMHESAHAMQNNVVSADDKDISEPHQCPCTPLDQHQDSDGCDTCVNCACHAPLSSGLILFSYNPIIRDLLTTEPFKFLPEVYLTKFIPPQILA